MTKLYKAGTEIQTDGRKSKEVEVVHACKCDPDQVKMMLAAGWTRNPNGLPDEPETKEDEEGSGNSDEE